MRIGAVDTDDRVVVIAEIGNNHEGDVDLAREMVRAAAGAGAHAVKFQAIDPRRLVRPSETARIAQLDRYRLTPADFRSLHELALEHGLGFSCTPFDVDAVPWLAPLVDVFKIASGDNDIPQLMRAIGAAGRPALVSGGMSDTATVRGARDTLRAAGAPQVGVLHCVSAYPTPPAAAQLATIPALRDALGPDTLIGYSDHTLGIDACVVAAALGARVLEKHFTLRHDLSDFRDHQLSAEPAELAALVTRVAQASGDPRGTLASIENAQELIGTPKNGVVAVEEATARAARRSLTPVRDLPAGHVLAPGDLAWLRPRDGLAPADEQRLLGQALTRSVVGGDALQSGDVTAI